MESRVLWAAHRSAVLLCRQLAVARVLVPPSPEAEGHPLSDRVRRGDAPADGATAGTQRPTEQLSLGERKRAERAMAKESATLAIQHAWQRRASPRHTHRPPHVP